MYSEHDKFPVGLIAQLVEHCTRIGNKNLLAHMCIYQVTMHLEVNWSNTLNLPSVLFGWNQDRHAKWNEIQKWHADIAYKPISQGRTHHQELILTKPSISILI